MRINFFCSKPPSLGHFVTTALGNWYSAHYLGTPIVPCWPPCIRWNNGYPALLVLRTLVQSPGSCLFFLLLTIILIVQHRILLWCLGPLWCSSKLPYFSLLPMTIPACAVSFPCSDLSHCDLSDEWHSPAPSCILSIFKAHFFFLDRLKVDSWSCKLKARTANNLYPQWVFSFCFVGILTKRKWALLDLLPVAFHSGGKVRPGGHARLW